LGDMYRGRDGLNTGVSVLSGKIQKQYYCKKYRSISNTKPIPFHMSKAKGEP
jgi:hypothetical protein